MVKKIILVGLLSGAFISTASLDALSFDGKISHAENVSQQKVINFSAEKIEYHSDDNMIVATGDVTLHHEKNILKADRVNFDRTTQEVKATGNISIRDGQGNIIYMEEAVLRDGLKDGFIRNVRMLFSDDAHLVAQEGIRIGEKTTFRKAAYSPCKTCNADGKREPLWHIRADSITHDEKNKVIKYKNVVLEIAGVPILYTPYFSHPDPSVHSASGFLTPEFATSSELGLNVTVPYYFHLSRDKDITLEPLITSNEGIIMAGTYRQHTGNGQYFIKGSATNAVDRDVNQIGTDSREVRGHIFSGGKFDLKNIDFAGDQWQWDYALRWVSDDTYLRRYYQDRTDVLESYARIENFTGRNYFTTGLYGFQGLDEEDISATTGYALPAFDLNIASTPGKWGNQYTIDASGVALVRTGGLNSQRMSIRGAWKLPLKTSLGDFYTFTASLRGDVYRISSAERQDRPIYGGTNGTFGRVLPKFAVDWKLPFIKNGQSSQQVIEPLVSIIIAPNNKNSTDIVNEDSRNFDFDENSLFSHNRYNGYDRWEAGTRINYGIRYSLYSGNTSVIATIGQSFRLQSSETFPIGSGYEGKSSDFVGRLDLIFGDYLDYVHRFRLDKNSLNLRRNEMILSGGTKKIRASVRYLDLDRGLTDLSNTELANSKEIGTGLKYYVNDQWTIHGSWVHDILKNDTISYDAGIRFKNECLEFGLRYEKRLTTDRDITPSSTFHLRLVLKHLG
ncbi:LPS-assembly protein LptD @ Organic solvent tolerance protein precursor [hydrothermal vent metagenome]|uniref:LPS-assembly protein LptD @ Organic solvent tolerance protein n=1 Tax=hydrothermal vent metagenome TaxID=652676 RepID=A0A3B0SPN6_9ZZZZ